jgi:hypothetical protein
MRELECNAKPTFRLNNRRVQLRFAEVDGRFICIGLEIGPKLRDDDVFVEIQDEDLVSLTTAEIRLPLRSLVQTWLERGAFARTGDPSRDVYEELTEFTDVLNRSQETNRRTGRPPLYGPDHYAEVAAVYREHLANAGTAPTKAVQKHFGTTKSTAAKWVATARNKYQLLP